MKRQTGFRLTERAHDWLKRQSQERGISKSDVIQEMINREIERETDGAVYKPQDRTDAP
jgi:predicted DNA-binding protein